MNFYRNRLVVGRTPQMGDSFAGIGGADLYTKLLLHFDKDIRDDSLFAKPIANANMAIDSAQSIFGGYSAKFTAASSQYLSIPDSTDWDFTGNFTIDFRVRFASLPVGAAVSFIFCGQLQDASNYTYIRIRNDGSNNLDWAAQGTKAAVSCSAGLCRSNPKVVINQWYHVAFVKTGNDWMVFQDGAQMGATTTDADPMPTLAAPFLIGNYGANAGTYFDGWLDEFRVSNGIARWTANFTPPVAPYSKKNWE